MKRILCLLCVLALAFSLLTACGQKPGNSSASYTSGDNLHPRNFQFSADWPENDFTEQLPQPKFSTALEEATETVYSIACETTLDQLKEYVEDLKAAGFTIDENIAEENAFSVIAYSYTASNANGYTVEVNYSNALGNLSTLTIKKPA